MVFMWCVNVMMQMWEVVAAAAMVVMLAHQALADVIISNVNGTVDIFSDSPASFGPPISLDGFKVRPRNSLHCTVEK